MTREMERTGRKTRPSGTMSITALTGVGTGPNPGLRGDRPVTSNLNHGATFKDHNRLLKTITNLNLFKNSVCTSQRTACVSFILTNLSITFWEINGI
jgi:hypothetical protein